MKTISCPKALCTFLTIGWLAACTPSNEEQTSIELPTDSTAVQPEVPATITKMEIHKLLIDSLFAKGGLVRGVAFGQPLSTIKTNETWELFEEDPSHIGYTFEAETLQSADILYERDKQNNLTAVDIDVYLNSEAESKALLSEIKRQFTEKYGQPQTDSLIWKIPTGGRVKVTAVTTNLDHGLTLRFLK